MTFIKSLYNLPITQVELVAQIQLQCDLFNSQILDFRYHYCYLNILSSYNIESNKIKPDSVIIFRIIIDRV